MPTIPQKGFTIRRIPYVRGFVWIVICDPAPTHHLLIISTGVVVIQHRSALVHWDNDRAYSNPEEPERRGCAFFGGRGKEGRKEVRRGVNKTQQRVSEEGLWGAGARGSASERACVRVRWRENRNSDTDTRKWEVRYYLSLLYLL